MKKSLFTIQRLMIVFGVIIAGLMAFLGLQTHTYISDIRIGSTSYDRILQSKDLIADIKQGFYVTDLIGSGVNGVTGDYSRGASGFWIENGEITYPVSEVTIAGHLLPMFKSLVPANDLEFRYGVNAPTLRIEGLTLGGR